jgi:hypothetical protein
VDANANVAAADGTRQVRLSWTQKLDLLGMAAAAVITTALIAAPMVGPYVDEDEAGLDAAPHASLVMAVAVPDSRQIAAVARSSSARTTASEKRPIAARPLAAMSRLATANPSTIAAASAAAHRSSKPFGRKLAGLFTGDGTYTVRPFPTVPSERQ